MPERDSDDLLRRALIEPMNAVSVAFPVTDLTLAESLTVVFHGRLDLGTVQTYVTRGERGAGAEVAGDELLRVPCDLDLAEAADIEEAEELYSQQTAVFRDALVGADLVLSLWRDPLEDFVGNRVDVDHRTTLELDLPAHRLMPCALDVPDTHIIVTPVCTPRPLAQGSPLLGMACVQQDFTRVYPLRDDPVQSLTDFMEASAEHAKQFADKLRHQEASVKRFFELSGENPDEVGVDSA